MLYHKNLLLSISFSEIVLGASEIALDWCKREGNCHKKFKHIKPRHPLGPLGLWCISTLHSRSFHLLIGSFSETSKTVCFHFVCPPFCEWLIRTRNPHGLKALAMCQWIRDGRGSYFFHGAGRGGEGQGQKSRGLGRAGNPPLPTVRGGAGKGSKSAGLGGAGAGNILRVLIEIICCSEEISIWIALSEVNLLNIHNLYRNHN